MPSPTTHAVTHDLLTEEELARELGRSVRTLQRWRARRIGPPYLRLGKELRYRHQAVRDWLLGLEQEQPRAKRVMP